MTGTIPRRARYLTFAGLATIALAVVAQLAVGASVVAADAYTVPLHQDPPITNSDFQKGNEDCPGSPERFGWHFVLTGNDATFVSLTTTFEDAGTIVTTVFGPPTDKHAYVYTDTDDTLLSASAQVTGGDPEDVRLVLSHTCAGTPPAETPSPTPSATVTPSESVSPTATVTPSESVQPSETVSPTVSVTPSETVSPTVSVTPSETVSPSESVQPTETVSPSESVAPTQTVAPSESVAPTETVAPSESVAPTETVVPSATVSGVVVTQNPSTSVSPTVRGVKQVRGPQPQVAGNNGSLPTTGNTVPVGVLLLVGFALIGAGVVSTVAGEAAPAVAGGKHRR